MATNGNYTHPDQFKGAVEPTSSGPTSTNNAVSAGNSNLSKDEVGWYFVEQYYTTLSKNPDKLHLFYGKRSQFVYGMEAEVANVSVGRQTIQERIKSLDFQNSKVRITNVDSQASFDNIVIQVIGESSIKSAEPKKFVQTFVLAPQPSGYFVVNDILRYINDEEEEEAAPEAEAAPEEQAAPEEVAEVSAQAEAEEPKVEQTPEEATGPAIDVDEVEKKLEEVSAAPQDVASNNGDAEPAVPEPAKVAETKVEEPAADPEAAAKEIAEEDVTEPEKPADPSPTPVAPTKAPAAAAEPEKPKPAPAPVPMKPMSWASRAAAAVGPKPVVPLPKTATPPAGQAKAPAPAAPAAAPVKEAAPAADAPAKEAQAQAAKEDSPSAEWQSVGADSKRQNRPQSISQAPTENYGTLGYVKYVTDKVKAEDLKGALAAHGELTYFDINRQKNCAFVEFATVAGYQAAAAANPHTVNGENIIVEPRRPKANAYGGSSYSSNTPRGNATGGGRGRGGFEGGNRSGSQGGGRGNFTGGQARGRGSVRGRGASQTAA
ncbi:NTF2 and RRM domain-containing protein [Colletotrichum scovillei]|uniref:NTF2 and RRM domain-containing protein n=1 Tax=Colletotrichum scovillei TaxID=1209932 RepID=A0A9P7UE44_9PEZI|nr:NTF2 and RRM domain-containing protein [Colletotrichum scovillei]KAF4783696.1 NTF2 and RRM domain-containing protein [Colletotrichum scovillei]KAG7051756.1 NTF2 and RRM domain-containing protein [Colletotrichum scovillei]KAG7070792.1 NTF2 and RRM domain-containing protein [Colletotrichum scovillei]KAG7079001.1 NTF2 and RRM domain-containing protein [Colletotrichum scovillei]